ncbi:unnamed protein product (macronuclear) [Paramecium tetraurelia]|uniref:Uncharacterized protein n=1 Tax=Paramecium tetraurelia TaxID=5888 RepID=A0EHD1_PARTE|nr:uncharacterized protein GSPATT00027046001 [Paramecium tetraurelia]CAK94722.1 unnamed protein product [Paramecium tetraurelia]|eukprot:XP_001462095.1 hypothetical protein (macronuclear) [Paramecium tetraurelia strain d4-2]
MKNFEEDRKNMKNPDAAINLSPNKSEIMIHQNRITKTIKHFLEQTFLSQSICLNPSKKKQFMNYDVYQDIMSHIANFINQQDMNLIMSLQNINEQQQSRVPTYILKHSIVIENNEKQQNRILEQIEDVLINIGERIESICISTYIDGDHDLDGQLQAVLNQYQGILNDIE